MTIADKLYKTDKDMLKEIIVIYQLEGLARMYFPEMLITHEDQTELNKHSSYRDLMKSSTYSGKVERRGGAKTQPHNLVIK